MNETAALDRRSFCTMAAGAAAALGAGSLVAQVAQAEEAAAADAEAAAAEAMAAYMAAQPRIYVVDRVVCKPGDAEAFLKEYLEVYAPKAQALGAELVSTLVAPPCWLPMDSNILTFTWRVAGVPGSWGLASPLRYDPEIVAWWAGVHERVVEQDRSYFADPADMEVLNNV